MARQGVLLDKVKAARSAHAAGAWTTNSYMGRGQASRASAEALGSVVGRKA